MNIVLSSKRPCRLDRGEARRVPQDARLPPIGYHVGCPRCRFVSAAVVGDDGLAIGEEGALLTLSRPLVCAWCLVRIHIRRSVCSLEETPDVRPVALR